MPDERGVFCVVHELKVAGDTSELVRCQGSVPLAIMNLEKVCLPQPDFGKVFSVQIAATG